MKKLIWIPLVIIVVGFCLAGATWVTNGNSVFKPGIYLDRNGVHTIDTKKIITVDETYQPSAVKSISIDVSYMNRIRVKEGEKGGKITVKGANYEMNGGLISALADGTLSVTAKDLTHGPRWSVGFDIGWWIDNTDCYLEITVPAGTKLEGLKAAAGAAKIDFTGLRAGSASIENNFGDIDIRDLTADSLDIGADAGKIKAENITTSGSARIENRFGAIALTGIKAADLTVTADAGEIRAKDIQTTGLLDITNHFGDVIANDVTSGSMALDLKSGKLSASSVKTGDLTAGNRFGEIRFDRLTLAGLCRVNADSGNVHIGLTNAEAEIGYDLDVDAGNISVGGSNHREGGKVSKGAANEKAHVTASNSFGNITLEFER
ncbi:hypothetical protein AGMMS49983_12180 [Clostridia bacterium]|nr:hypothetical protein AGMMS49983_12180 [Clostridia bacterium]